MSFYTIAPYADNGSRTSGTLRFTIPEFTRNNGSNIKPKRSNGAGSTSPRPSTSVHGVVDGPAKGMYTQTLAQCYFRSPW